MSAPGGTSCASRLHALGFFLLHPALRTLHNPEHSIGTLVSGLPFLFRCALGGLGSAKGALLQFSFVVCISESAGRIGGGWGYVGQAVALPSFPTPLPWGILRYPYSLENPGNVLECLFSHAHPQDSSCPPIVGAQKIQNPTSQPE